MTTRVYATTTLAGFGALIEEDLRVIRQIESRAQELQAQLERLESRWHARVDKLQRRQTLTKNTVRMAYDFRDILA